ncbi:MAG TPA: hypothetical protein DDW17_05440 [Deltaproteobacteria bacterium]|nr:hypothetical protein [Deltaproteobacteria bacterium]
MLRRYKLIDFFLLIAFKILLEISYITFVYPLFRYMGFTLNPDIVKFIESYLTVTFFFLLIDSKYDLRPSDIFFKVLFLLMIVPMSSFYALADMDRGYYYVFMLSFLVTFIIRRLIPSFKINKIDGSNKALILLMVIILLSVPSFLIALNGMPSLTAFDLRRVYEIRGETLYGPESINYLVRWVTNVLNCFLIGLAVYERKYWLLIPAVFLQMVIYAITGHKSMFFAPFAVLFLLIIVKRWRLMRVATLSLLVLFMLCYILYVMGVSSLPASLLIRRVFYNPPQISYMYYDYFSRNPHTYLSQSKAGLGLAENPYETSNLPITKMMGSIYAGNENTNVNTGYLGDAFMNFGFGGMMVFSYILGLIMVMIDSLSRRTNIYIAVACSVIPMQKLINGSLFTTLLSNGLLFSMLVIWLYNKREKAQPAGGKGYSRIK